jgi:hypothetical protein
VYITGQDTKMVIDQQWQYPGRKMTTRFSSRKPMERHEIALVITTSDNSTECMVLVHGTYGWITTYGLATLVRT